MSRWLFYCSQTSQWFPGRSVNIKHVWYLWFQMDRIPSVASRCYHSAFMQQCCYHAPSSVHLEAFILRPCQCDITRPALSNPSVFKYSHTQHCPAGSAYPLFTSFRPLLLPMRPAQRGITSFPLYTAKMFIVKAKHHKGINNIHFKGREWADKETSPTRCCELLRMYWSMLDMLILTDSVWSWWNVFSITTLM